MTTSNRRRGRRPGGPPCFYYITDIRNVPSILEHGVLSRKVASARNLESFGIHDQGVVDYRHRLSTPDGTSLWEYANLFLQPRNPMLYRVTRERSVAEVAVCGGP